MNQADRARLLLRLTALFSLVVVMSVRIRLLGIPLERDEGEYAYIGHLVLQGIPPYQDAYSMKLPGIHLAYALMMATFGESARGIHMGLLVANVATIVLVFLLARRLLDEAAAYAAASAYGMLALSPTVLGLFSHATHFVVLPAIAGLLMLHDAIRKGRTARFLLSGVALGLAPVMKQHGIFFVLLGFFWIALEGMRQGSGTRRVVTWAFWYGIGAVVPYAAVVAALAAAGVFGNFWFWTVAYAGTYASQVPAGSLFHLFSRKLMWATGATLPLWLFAQIGWTTPFWDNVARGQKSILLLLPACSLLAIFPGFYFREHYFILVVPAVSILTGAVVSAAVRRQGHGGIEGKVATVALFLFIASVGLPVASYADQYFLMAPVKLSRAIYGPNPFPEAVEIAARIEASSRTNDRVAVLGSEPEILFYSGRRSATGHIYMYDLMEDQPHASRMQRETVQEIEASRPKHIVAVNVPTSWLVRKESDRFIFRWMDMYLETNYRCVGVAEIHLTRETSYVWGEAAASFQPRSPYYILLFERRDTDDADQNRGQR